MTPSDKEYFEDLVAKAIQSGKKETSGLVEEIIHRIEPATEKAIAKYVNGKIDALHVKVDNYIVSDNEWKKEYEPYLEGLASLSISGKLIVWGAMAIATILGALLAIKKLFV